MRIVTQEKTGGPDVLRLAEAPDPVPGAGEVLVAVAAAGVNPVDVAVREGAFPLLGEPPFTIGWDIAGRVIALGEGVNDFAVGERVFGMPRFPDQVAAYAERASVPAAHLARIPEGMSDAEAGALPLAGLTAWQALVGTAELKAGQKVLIHAGAGGVGHLAVQIAKALGAAVVATTSAGKLDFVRSLGADRVIDYRADDLKAERGHDVVLDTIGGVHVEGSLDALRDGGIVVALIDASDRAKARAEAEGKRLQWIMVQPDRAGLEALADLHAAGRLRIEVARRFPLTEAAAAQDFLGTAPVGKVVLEPAA